MKRQPLQDKYSYLLDAKFGRWTVMKITKINGRGFAICKCECGTVKPVNIINLTHNLTKDCGCGRKNKLRETFSKNLVGQRFGKLTVCELLNESNKFNRRIYRCKCDCGNEIIVPSSCLTTNHTLSCGCLLSYGNMYIQNYLTKINVQYQKEYTVRINDHYYRFDFYLPQYNMFIEYDGEQHYVVAGFGMKTEEEKQYAFHMTQLNDKIKNKYCEENNIYLLRIPYWERNNIETIINHHLQRLSEKGLAL